MKMGSDKRREAQASYNRKWREKNPNARHNNNDKVNKAKPIQCECGGCYKDISHLRTRHFATTKHRCWDAKNKLIPLYIKAGKHRDNEHSTTRIDAFCEKKGIYTNSEKLKIYETMKRQILEKLEQSESENESESEEEEPPVRETHYQKIIKMSLQDEPKNTIIKATATPPPTPCPTSSEEESEESDQTEEESEGGDTGESTSEDEKLIYRTKTELDRDRQNALNRLKRFQNKEVADSPPSPPPKQEVNIETYLEEASIPSEPDPFGDRALEEIKQRLRFV